MFDVDKWTVVWSPENREYVIFNFLVVYDHTVYFSNGSR